MAFLRLALVIHTTKIPDIKWYTQAIYAEFHEIDTQRLHNVRFLLDSAMRLTDWMEWNWIPHFTKQRQHQSMKFDRIQSHSTHQPFTWIESGGAHYQFKVGNLKPHIDSLSSDAFFHVWNISENPRLTIAQLFAHYGPKFAVFGGHRKLKIFLPVSRVTAFSTIHACKLNNFNNYSFDYIKLYWRGSKRAVYVFSTHFQRSLCICVSTTICHFFVIRLFW